MYQEASRRALPMFAPVLSKNSVVGLLLNFYHRAAA
jgi:hypothetical protein